MLKMIIRIPVCIALACVATTSFAATTKVIHPIKTNATDTTSVAAAPAESEESPVTGYMTFTSNYIYRGISNSNNNPAVQGSLTYTFLSTGIYFNVWGSSVSFAEPYRGRTATIELDGILGIHNDVGENFTYDVNIERYNYPRASGASYNELIATLWYYFLVGQVAYSNDAYNSGQPGTYGNLGVSFDIPQKYAYFENVNLSAGVGHYSLGSKAGEDYNDYNIAIKKDIKNYSLLFQWTDTSGANLGSVGGNQFIGSITANF